MPKFLEKKLKKEYGEDSDIPYKVMNDMGAMHGNKETAKGHAMEIKHALDTATRTQEPGRPMLGGKVAKKDSMADKVAAAKKHRRK